MNYLIKKIFKDGTVEDMPESNDRTEEEEIKRFIMICDHYTAEEAKGGPDKFKLYSGEGNLIKEIKFDESFFLESFNRTSSILNKLLQEEAQHKR